MTYQRARRDVASIHLFLSEYYKDGHTCLSKTPFHLLKIHSGGDTLQLY